MTSESQNQQLSTNTESNNSEKDFVQIRHKDPMELRHPRELVVAVPPMHSNVNLSRIVRAAGCCGVRKIICCGNASLNAKIARETGIDLELEQHRTLSPELIRKWKEKGWRIVGLEQTNDSYWLHEYQFPEKTFLIVGNERLGIEPEILRRLDDVVEIPMYGLPFSHNAATATAIAMYEYCRQHPR